MEKIATGIFLGRAKPPPGMTNMLGPSLICLNRVVLARGRCRWALGEAAEKR